MFLSFSIYTALLFILSPSYLLFSTPITTGTGTCDDSALDWYTEGVGETPCTTYERLRRLCNPDFRVGTMNASLPPDVCSEQVADCCCNSIAFDLSMLCLTCQQGLVNKVGFDAPNGTYQRYLAGTRTDGEFCSPNTNGTLTDLVQAGVCNRGIKIINDLYSGGWTNIGGGWFYLFFSQQAALVLSSMGDKAFHTCPETSSSNIASTSFPSSTSSGSQTTANHLSCGAIAGITITAIIIVVSIIAAIVYFVRRSRRRKHGFTPYTLLPSATSIPGGKGGTGSTSTPRSRPLRRPPPEGSTYQEERMSEGEGPPPEYRSHIPE